MFDELSQAAARAEAKHLLDDALNSGEAAGKSRTPVNARAALRRTSSREPAPPPSPPILQRSLAVNKPPRHLDESHGTPIREAYASGRAALRAGLGPDECPPAHRAHEAEWIRGLNDAAVFLVNHPHDPFTEPCIVFQVVA
jgi:hypothetical protein